MGTGISINILYLRITYVFLNLNFVGGKWNYNFFFPWIRIRNRDPYGELHIVDLCCMVGASPGVWLPGSLAGLRQRGREHRVRGGFQSVFNLLDLNVKRFLKIRYRYRIYLHWNTPDTASCLVCLPSRHWRGSGDALTQIMKRMPSFDQFCWKLCALFVYVCLRIYEKRAK